MDDILKEIGLVKYAHRLREKNFNLSFFTRILEQ